MQTRENRWSIRNIEDNLQPRFQLKGDEGQNIYERMNEMKIPAVSVTVIKEGKVAWSREYSQSDEGRKPSSVLSLFQAASISKTVNTVLALKLLVDSGVMGLDDDVSPWLKDWAIPGNTYDEKVTLRRLLSHSAGLNVGGFSGYPSTHKTLPSITDILNGNPEADPHKSADDYKEGEVNTVPVNVVNEPGSEFSYSGGGTLVVQKLIEDVTGESYATLAQKHIFAPLLMDSSTFKIKYPDLSPEVKHHAHNADGSEITGSWRLYSESGAAGLWTTSEDLAKFAIGIQKAYRGEDNSLLTQKTAQEMLTKQSNSKPSDPSFGLGFELYNERVNGELAVGHPGSNDGYKCHYVILPKRGCGAVVMTNSDNGTALTQEVIRSIFSTYNWPSYDSAVKTPVELQVKDLALCAGKFTALAKDQSGNTITVDIEIQIDDNLLMLTIPNPMLALDDGATVTLPLTAESNHSFFNVEYNLEVKFTEDHSELTYYNLTASRVSIENTEQMDVSGHTPSGFSH